MRTGDIILVPFPFAELSNVKLRPAVVVSVTKDKFQDIIIAATSSVVPAKLSDNEMFIFPSSANKLKTQSVLKVDRLATVKQLDVVASLGHLDLSELNIFKTIFKELVD